MKCDALRWLGHVMSMKENDRVRKVCECMINGVGNREDNQCNVSVDWTSIGENW